jgi:hypothetical protein
MRKKACDPDQKLMTLIRKLMTLIKAYDPDQKLVTLIRNL